MREADIVCTVTQAREPILLGRWLKPGAHINAVGACSPLARELDSEAVLRSRIYADQREAALRDSGDLAIPLKEGSLDARKICGEVGQVLLGSGALIKNAIGTAALIFLILLCLVPLLKLGIISFLYQGAAAVVQPAADKRIVACISAVGNGTRLLLKLVLYTVILFLVTVAIVCAASNANYYAG